MSAERNEEKSTPVGTSVVEVLGVPVFARTAGEGEPAVLFFHGASFHSGTWEDNGTLARVAAAGMRAVSVDLPGYGRTPAAEVEPVAFVRALADALGLERFVLLAASMSGRYVLPYVASRPERLVGWVAVAPVGIDRYLEALRDNPIPALLVWGERDRIVPPAQGERLAGVLPHARFVVLEGAGHACYLDRPDEFHEHLLAFLSQRRGR